MNDALLRQMLIISREMAETHDIDRLLILSMEKTLEIIDAELCYLILLRPDGPLDFRARSISSESHDEEHTDELSRTIFDEVISTGEARVVVDALSDNRYSAHSSVINLQIRSVMCVPLISRATILGALYVENRTISGAFRQDDLEPLIFFANQAAASIDTALIIANLEELVTARTKELENSWHEAVEANKMRTSLLGQLAHDMRTPATVVMFSLSNLQNPRFGTLTEKQQNWVERGLYGIKQMNDLVSNVFDLTKVEMNVLEINMEAIDLQIFLERIYEIGSALPWKESVTFNYEVLDTSVVIMIDPIRIQQVLMNLISNAVKFTDKGQVVLHAKVNNDYLEIGVRDTGEGIHEDAQARIFERFRQYDDDDARRTGGAGLGLAICRELVEMHKGRIWVESTPQVGSDFVFSLPL